MRFKRIRVTGAAFLMVTCGTLLGAHPAGATETVPGVCSPPGYLTSQSAEFVPNTATRVYGQSGGTLSIQKGTTNTVSGSLQTTVSADAGVIFAQVSTSVAVSVGLSKSVTTTVGYSWLVPASQPTGWLEMGAHGYQINWKYGSYNSHCQFVVTRTGGLSGVSSNVQFAHS